MSEKFTPGPWNIVDGAGLNVEGANKRMVASTACMFESFDSGSAYRENKANANLIAAAPEMYEALQAILPYVPISSASEGGAVARSENVIAADKVRAALKKARGDE